MILESVENLNKRLLDYWGIGEDSLPNFRIVFSDEQYEKRYETYNEFHGEVFLRRLTGIHETLKYPWLKGKYILEQLVAVPLGDIKQLAGLKLSYEPRWVFQDKQGNALPPKWEAIEIVIKSIEKNRDQSYFAKYIEGDAVQERLERVMKIEDELFGNETEVGDALAHKQAVTVPTNYEASK